MPDTAQERIDRAYESLGKTNRMNLDLLDEIVRLRKIVLELGGDEKTLLLDKPFREKD